MRCMVFILHSVMNNTIRLTDDETFNGVNLG